MKQETNTKGKEKEKNTHTFVALNICPSNLTFLASLAYLSFLDCRKQKKGTISPDT